MSRTKRDTDLTVAQTAAVKGVAGQRQPAQLGAQDPGPSSPARPPPQRPSSRLRFPSANVTVSDLPRGHGHRSVATAPSLPTPPPPPLPYTVGRGRDRDPESGWFQPRDGPPGPPPAPPGARAPLTCAPAREHRHHHRRLLSGRNQSPRRNSQPRSGLPPPPPACPSGQRLLPRVPAASPQSRPRHTTLRRCCRWARGPTSAPRGSEAAPHLCWQVTSRHLLRGDRGRARGRAGAFTTDVECDAASADVAPPSGMRKAAQGCLYHRQPVTRAQAHRCHLGTLKSECSSRWTQRVQAALTSGGRSHGFPGDGRPREKASLLQQRPRQHGGIPRVARSCQETRLQLKLVFSCFTICVLLFRSFCWSLCQEPRTRRQGWDKPWAGLGAEAPVSGGRGAHTEATC